MLLKRANLFFLVSSCLASFVTFAQNETTSFSYGYNFIEKKNFLDFQFNRTTATESEDAFEIKIVKGAFVLNPSAEAHLGSGNESSENNVQVYLNSYLKVNLKKKANSKWTSLIKGNIISPHLSADKNFNIYQLYGTFGGNYNAYYSRRDLLGYIEFGFGANYDMGTSKIDSTEAAQQVSRMHLSPSFQWSFAGKVSDEKYKDHPELDPDFVYRAKVSLRYSYYYFFEQDERIVDDKSFGFLKFVFDYRILRRVKLGVEYKTGMVEPLYKKLNAFSIGFALVN